MPRIRLLADLAQANASAINGADAAGNPVFEAQPGSVVQINLDATGWAGADSVTGSTWESLDGVTLSSRALSGSVASCNAYLPDTIADQRGYRVRNTLVLDTGATRKTTVWLRAV